MSLSVAEHVRAQQVDELRSPSLRGPAAGSGGAADPLAAAAEQAWYEGVWFEGPLDPRGTIFAALLALTATVGLLVVVTAVVRVATGA
jgi:hypothetical protein